MSISAFVGGMLELQVMRSKHSHFGRLVNENFSHIRLLYGLVFTSWIFVGGLFYHFTVRALILCMFLFTVAHAVSVLM